MLFRSIHTIGIGKDQNKNILSRIANEANGKYWDAENPSNVISLYQEIAVYF